MEGKSEQPVARSKTRSEFIGDLAWTQRIRTEEVRAIFGAYGRGYFGRALELGCGTGQASPVLAEYCQHLVATDFDRTKIVCESSANVEFGEADATDLRDFESDCFDLVFSSNVLINLPEPLLCLLESRRVAKPGGLIVHSMPTQTWKGLQMLLYYPYLFSIAWRRLRPGGRPVEGPAPSALDDNLRIRGSARRGWRILLPGVCGAANSHREEWRRCGVRSMHRLFLEAGLRLEAVARLPFYHSYGCRFRLLLQLGQSAGLSACMAYYLRKS